MRRVHVDTWIAKLEDPLQLQLELPEVVRVDRAPQVPRRSVPRREILPAKGREYVLVRAPREANGSRRHPASAAPRERKILDRFVEPSLEILLGAGDLVVERGLVGAAAIEVRPRVAADLAAASAELDDLFLGERLKVEL